MKKYGLLGRKLSHSFSPTIHRLLKGYEYELFEREREELEDFFKNGDFDGINVTIPYKIDAMKYCGRIDEGAVKIGCINTVKREKDGSFSGYNTDLYGFLYLLERSGINPEGKNCLILGSGASSQTVAAALEMRGAKDIKKVSRTGEINYENVYDLSDTEIIVNTTPVGMYPDNGQIKIDIERFKRLESCVDLIYNPLKTAFLFKAEKLGIKSECGLPMLVAQAKKAAEIFTGESIDDSETERVLKIIEGKVSNIILVGMPGCGKTTVGRLAAKKLGKDFYDLDEVIEAAAGKTCGEIIEQEGEADFRELEKAAAAEAGKKSGAVIATGGGTVTVAENFDSLKQNGTIIWLQRELDKLTVKGRPLSNKKGGVEALYDRRKELYEKFADFKVQNSGTIEQAADEIVRRTEDANTCN